MKTRRIQVDVNDELMTSLQERLGQPDGKVTLSMALDLLNWAVGEIHKGRSIASIEHGQEEGEEDGYHELVLPGLTN